MAHYSRHVADTKLLKTKLPIRVPCLESLLASRERGQSRCSPSPAASRRTPGTTPALCPSLASPPASRSSFNRNQSVTLIRPRISGEARRPKPGIILQMPNSQILTTTTNGGRENSQSRVIIWTICIRKGFCILAPFTLSRPWALISFYSNQLIPSLFLKMCRVSVCCVFIIMNNLLNNGSENFSSKIIVTQ